MSKIGATGDFPAGKIRDDDEGGLVAAVSTDANGNVIVDFGKPVTWVAMPKADAVKLAILLLHHTGVRVETKKS
jgi:hypothetical protein